VDVTGGIDHAGVINTSASMHGSGVGFDNLQRRLTGRLSAMEVRVGG